MAAWAARRASRVRGRDDDVKPKGKRFAIAAGVIASALLALTGYLLRDDVRWWWRMGLWATSARRRFPRFPPSSR